MASKRKVLTIGCHRVLAARRNLERRHLEGDVITNQNVTVQQLMYPKNTPDWQLIKPEHFERGPTPKGWKAGLEKL
ncbi:hypothetical protein PPTG_21871 [Phytophthora nicotianae INRA-310]|uniref:Uncharacterized protein n=1 Tax=Phytophthora nicotianae (strain INRA-310) TaxID=761204 RepID=W2QSE2_PHYN3|nr:hypothetical protein PPTG_21871 [Phytophthora nicotianae INRA-310]ETN16117.1 hypothetical protein PPTG_21871 [Phytophthora nicotianae INRA-310]